MGMTIAEKILARASDQDRVKPGDFIEAKAEWTVICDLGWYLIEPTLREVNGKILNPEKVVVVFDHKVPPENVWSAELYRRWRVFCAEHGIVHLHDIGNHGISHQLAVEKGYARPGVLFVNVDTHANTCGAVGCFATALGTDIVSDLVLGWNWYRVPESIRVHLSGTMGPGVMVRDVAQYIVGQVGASGATDRVMEFVGPAVNAMSIDERMTLCNWSRKCEAVTGIVNPDEKTIAYVRSRTDADFEPFTSDPDAHYASELRYDISSIEPLVASPPDPTNTRAVSEVAGTRIHQAFLGACSGGRLEDIRAAAEILRGRTVHQGVRMIISPASQEIWQAAESEGLWGVLAQAGALITPSTCGTCYGGLNGILADEEVCIATSTENHPGRMGSPKADIYLASPATVAASAVVGSITDPRALLTE